MENRFKSNQDFFDESWFRFFLYQNLVMKFFVFFFQVLIFFGYIKPVYRHRLGATFRWITIQSQVSKLINKQAWQNRVKLIPKKNLPPKNQSSVNFKHINAHNMKLIWLKSIRFPHSCSILIQFDCLICCPRHPHPTAKNLAKYYHAANHDQAQACSVIKKAEQPASLAGSLDACDSVRWRRPLGFTQASMFHIEFHECQSQLPSNGSGDCSTTIRHSRSKKIRKKEKKSNTKDHQ